MIEAEPDTSSKTLATRLVYLAQATLVIGIGGAVWSGAVLGTQYPTDTGGGNEQFNWGLFIIASLGGALLTLIPFGMLVFASHVLVWLEEIRDLLWDDLSETSSIEQGDSSLRSE